MDNSAAVQSNQNKVSAPNASPMSPARCTVYETGSFSVPTACYHQIHLGEDDASVYSKNPPITVVQTTSLNTFKVQNYLYCRYWEIDLQPGSPIHINTHKTHTEQSASVKNNTLVGRVISIFSYCLHRECCCSI